MNGTISLSFMVLTMFVGFAVGRIGHCSDNHNNRKVPHHWTYGLFSIVLGLFLLKNVFFNFVIIFGFGLFVSDIKDFFSFFHLRFFKPSKADKAEKKKFWSIN